jgi:hypothetical protein
MVFSTRWYAKQLGHAELQSVLARARCLVPVLVLAVLALALLSPAQAAKSGFRIEQAATRVVDDVVMLSAQIDYQLNEELLEALDSGVPLFFVLTIEVSRERKWWWDSDIASLEQRYLLLFHALSEKYVVHNLNSGAQENFRSLNAALSALGKIEDLPLIDANLLEQNKRYWVRLKAALDIEALPAPIRPLAYLSPKWRLETKWHDWSLNP